MTRRPVVVSPYQPRWVDEFTRIAKHIRDLVGPAAIRIDHIGSTAVPGLGAKDVIDIQITVSHLDAAGGLTHALRIAGFRHGTTFEHDLFRKKPETDPELRKLYMREPEGEHAIPLAKRGFDVTGYDLSGRERTPKRRASPPDGCVATCASCPSTASSTL